MRKGKIHVHCVPMRFQYPLEHISVDLIGPLPESSGYNAIIVMLTILQIHHSTPNQQELLPFGAAHIYRDHVWTNSAFLEKPLAIEAPIRRPIHARPLTMTGV